MCLKIKATKHAKQRLKERNGIPKSSLERITEKAYTLGITREETKGLLRSYLDAQYEKNGGFGNELRVYGDYLYVFHNSVLITVYTVPQKLRKYIKIIKREKFDEDNSKSRRPDIGLQ